MVIGSPTALADLGKRLLAAAQSPPVSTVQKWPAVAATPDVEGPYLGDPNFRAADIPQAAAARVESALVSGHRSVHGCWSPSHTGLDSQPCALTSWSDRDG
jgi:hypothetical protein